MKGPVEIVSDGTLSGSKVYALGVTEESEMGRLGEIKNVRGVSWSLYVNEAPAVALVEILFPTVDVISPEAEIIGVCPRCGAQDHDPTVTVT